MRTVLLVPSDQTSIALAEVCQDFHVLDHLADIKA
jgi:hypothetical protein